MPPDNRHTAGVLPLERSDDQAIMLQRMAQLTQRLLGPWEHADGHLLPRLTLPEAVAQLYEWSTEYRDHPELAQSQVATIKRRETLVALVQDAIAIAGFATAGVLTGRRGSVTVGLTAVDAAGNQSGYAQVTYQTRLR